MEAMVPPVDWMTAATVGHSACHPPTPAFMLLHHLRQIMPATNAGTRFAAAARSLKRWGFLFCGIGGGPAAARTPGVSGPSATSTLHEERNVARHFPQTSGQDAASAEHRRQAIPVCVPGAIGIRELCSLAPVSLQFTVSQRCESPTGSS